MAAIGSLAAEILTAIVNFQRRPVLRLLLYCRLRHCTTAALAQDVPLTVVSCYSTLAASTAPHRHMLYRTWGTAKQVEKYCDGAQTLPYYGTRSADKVPHLLWRTFASLPN